MTAGRATDIESGGQAVSQRGDTRFGWLLALALFTLFLVLNGFVFRETWRVLLHTWTSIGTYSYGLIVPFLSIYLVVRLRSELVQLKPTPSPWGIGATVLASLIWVVGDLADVQTIQQFAVLALIPSAGIALFGAKISRVAAFPLAYVLMAVPAGEFLIPHLIELTADFVVVSLESLGIPVFRDGPFIRVPAGDFHVVKACSGIRYLLTSLVLGTLFAYLSYRSWRRRGAFLLVCLVVPIVANWLRATGIVLIGQATNMELAGGIDHIIYGWLFFGFVMFVIFLIGSRFREFDEPAATVPALKGDSSIDSTIRIVPWFLTIFGLVVAVAAGPIVSATVSNRAAASIVERHAIMLPAALGEWSRQDVMTTDWAPVFVGASLRRSAEYRRRGNSVTVTAVFYDSQAQGAELIGAQNSLYDPMRWWIRSDEVRTVFLDANTVDKQLVRELGVSDGQRNRLIWSWYSISGRELASEYRAKLATIRALLAHDGSGGFLMALAVEYDQDIEVGRLLMEDFLQDYSERFGHCLETSTDYVGDRCD